jgi:hypothetical protein
LGKLDGRRSEGGVTRILGWWWEIIFRHARFFKDIEGSIVKSICLGSVVSQWI